MQNDQRNCRNVFKRVLAKDSLNEKQYFHECLTVWGLALGLFAHVYFQIFFLYGEQPFVYLPETIPLRAPPEERNPCIGCI